MVVRKKKTLLVWLCIAPLFLAGGAQGSSIETNFSGYLVDFYCYGLLRAGGLALDGTDVIKSPWEHTVHCLRDPPRCFESGFYLAYNKGTKDNPEYAPKFKLDDAGNRKAKQLLDSYAVGHGRDNVHGHFTVTGRGQHNGGDGILITSELVECESRVPGTLADRGDNHECDSVCSVASGDCVTPEHEISLTPPILLWGHVLCMVLSWGTLLPLGVLWAHNLRENKRKVCSAPIWFAGHRLLQSIGWTLQLAGFAFIIAHKEQGGGGAHFKAPHEIIGLCVVIVGSLQPLNAQLRHLKLVGHPQEPGPYRKQWEYLHKGCGYLAALFGATNVVVGIFYAHSIGFSGDFIAVVATIAGLSLGTQVPSAIFLEVRRFLRRGKSDSVGSE